MDIGGSPAWSKINFILHGWCVCNKLVVHVLYRFHDLVGAMIQQHASQAWVFVEKLLDVMAIDGTHTTQIFQDGHTEFRVAQTIVTREVGHFFAVVAPETGMRGLY